MTIEEILNWIENYENPLADLDEFQKELIELIKKFDFNVTEGGQKSAIGYAGGTGIVGDNTNGGIYQTVECVAHAESSQYVFINDAA